MKKYLLAFLTATALTGACTPIGNEFREVTAERIARPAFMTERKIEAGGMKFQLWERMHQVDGPANIYIEGDGDTDPEEDSTPNNPVGLHLASRDNADNLGWIGRACQYQEVPDEEVCNPKYWSTRRAAPEVIAAYNEILDDMKARWDITEFNLVGYDGGAGIAAAIAAGRSDVASLRTVAGDLNPDMVDVKQKSRMDADNVRATAIAPQLATMPQHHFLGAGDTVTPPSVYHSFRQAMGPSECVHYTLVQDADHKNGFVEKWPELLKSSISCTSAATSSPDGIEMPQGYIPAPFPPVPEDIDHGQK